jgi:hypothetical protein
LRGQRPVTARDAVVIHDRHSMGSRGSRWSARSGGYVAHYAYCNLPWDSQHYFVLLPQRKSSVKIYGRYTAQRIYTYFFDCFYYM